MARNRTGSGSANGANSQLGFEAALWAAAEKLARRSYLQGRAKQPTIGEDLDNAMVADIHEFRSLAELRDALLPKLLSGELRVPAAIGKLKANP